MEKGVNIIQNKNTKTNNHNKNYHKNNNQKYFYNSNKRKKDKKYIKNEMPETPHNTGQYLSHIHQESFNKKKVSQLDEDANDNNEHINYYIDNEDDNDDIENINLDFQFVKDKDRDNIMSLEGQKLNDFLFK